MVWDYIYYSGCIQLLMNPIDENSYEYHLSAFGECWDKGTHVPSEKDHVDVIANELLEFLLQTQDLEELQECVEYDEEGFFTLKKTF